MWIFSPFIPHCLKLCRESRGESKISGTSGKLKKNCSMWVLLCISHCKELYFVTEWQWFKWSERTLCGRLDGGFKPHQCLWKCTSEAQLQCCHQVLHWRWIWEIHCTQVIKESILALKSRADVTRKWKDSKISNKNLIWPTDFFANNKINMI